MTPQLVTIEYAHCVKWTQGQLDCAPWSQYELRSVAATLTQHRALLDEIEHLVTLDGAIEAERLLALPASAGGAQ